VNNPLKNILLKNISGALLTVNIGQGRSLHFLAGETKSVPESTLESKDAFRLFRKGFLAVTDEKPAAPEKKKSKS
jgi:hypothetical protein